MEENKVLLQITQDSVGTACQVHCKNLDEQFDMAMALCTFFEKNPAVFFAFLKLYDMRQSDPELQKELEKNTIEVSNYDFNQLLKK